MLQIISRKFFKSTEKKFLHITPCKEVIYSNISLWEKIETSIFTIEPVHNHREINTYIISFDNKIERQSGGTSIVSTGVEEIVKDIVVCLSFYFKGVFMTDVNYLKELLRDKSDVGERDLPIQMLPSVLGKELGGRRRSNVEEFCAFIDSLIYLKRKDYIKIIKAIRQQYNSMLLLNVNKDLAYTSMVTVGESLAQSFDSYEVIWQDCDEKLVKGLNPILEDIDSSSADMIKAKFMEHMHPKLSLRYRNYYLDKLDDEYFMEDAIGVKMPCPKAKLLACIKSTYNIRSKYVHNLKGLPNEIIWSQIGEVMVVDGEFAMSFEGLVRMNRFVIMKTIESMESIEREEINYFDELPGMMRVQWAPQYRIHNEKGYTIDSANEYLSGLLQIFESIFYNEKVGVPNLDKVCNEITKLLKGINGSIEKKIPLVVFLKIYNKYFPDENRMNGKILAICNSVMKVPSIQTIAYFVMYEGQIEYEIDDIQRVFDEYMQDKYKKKAFKVPKTVETVIACLLVNHYLESEQKEAYMTELKRLIAEHPGNEYLIGLYRDVQKNEEMKEVDARKVFGIEK